MQLIQQHRSSAAAEAPPEALSRSSNIKMPAIEPQLNGKDKALVRLFMASCFHKWELLEGEPYDKACAGPTNRGLLRRKADRVSAPNADLGKNCYSQGCTIEEVRGCVRHLIV